MEQRNQNQDKSLEDQTSSNSEKDDSQDVKERLYRFVTVFVQEFEKQITKYFDETTGKTKKSPKSLKALGSVVGMSERILKPKLYGYYNIPYSKPVKQILGFFGERIHIKKANKVTNEFSEEILIPESFRAKLVDAGVHIFQCFECQYMKINSDAGWPTAIDKIAKDAMERVMNYIEKHIRDQPEFDISYSIIKGIIFGESKGVINIYIQTNTVKNGHVEWKIASIYKKVGLLIKTENGTHEYYKKKDGSSKTKKYGYRLLKDTNSNNITEEINENYTKEDPAEEYRYMLKEDIEKISMDILNTINNADPVYTAKTTLQNSIETKDSSNEIQKIVSKTNEIIDEVKKTSIKTGETVEKCYKVALEIKHHNYHMESKDPVWFNVRKTNKYFTGREEELEKINKELEPGKLIVINGFNGVGKSQLASKYAHTCHNNDPNKSILWINAETDETTKNSFIDLYRKIKKENRKDEEESIKYIIDNVYNYFSTTKCLIIFDNAEKYFTIKDYLPFFILSPNASVPEIIITSSVMWGQNMIPEEIILYNLKLEKFSNSEAREFVKCVLEIKDHSQDVQITKLIQELYNFPLALQQAVAYIKIKNEIMKEIQEEYTVTDYLKEYQEKSKVLLAFEKFEQMNEYNRTTYTTLQIVLDKIKNHTECLQILQVIAYFATDSIPVKLLKTLNDDKHLTACALNLLKQYFIIVRDDDEINVHGLIQKAIRIEIERENKEEQCLEKVFMLFRNFVANSRDRKSIKSHIISVWNYAYKYKKLISTFIINATQIEITNYFHLIAGGSEFKIIATMINNIELEKIVNIINFKDKKGKTSLHFAAINSDKKVLDLLIKTGGDIHTKTNDNWTPLHIASKHGKLENVRILLQHNSNIEAKTCYPGNTPLHLSIKYNSLKVTKLLLEYNADINARNNGLEAYTPLHMAVELRQKKILKLLLNSNLIEIDSKTCFNLSRTAMHVAARNGAKDIIKILLEKGSDITIKDSRRYTVLHFAVEYNHFELVEFLINLNLIEIDALTNRNETAMHFAARNGSIDILKLLLENGSDIEKTDSRGYTALHYAVEKKRLKVIEFLLNSKLIKVNVLTKKNETSLHLAARKGVNENIIEYLLEKGSDVKIKDLKGYTPLHYAVENDQITIAKILLKTNSIKIDAQTKNSKKTLMHFAAVNGALDIIKILVERGSDVNIKDSHRFTPLHYAIRENKKKVTKFLLLNSNLAEINAVTKNNETALHFAAQNGAVDIVNILLEKGSDANIKDIQHYTPLHYAIENIHVAVVNILLNLNLIEFNSETALHFAAKTGALNIITKLLEKGCDAKVIDSLGYTTLHYAVKYNRTEVVNFLLNLNRIEIDAFTKIQETAMHFAVKKGTVGLIKCLLEKGSDAKLMDSRGYTVLHYAAKSNRIEVLEFLLNLNLIEIDATTVNNKTAMHFAAQKGALNIIKLLLRNGSDIKKSNSRGYTALHYAAKYSHAEVVEFLLNSNLIEIDALTKNNKTATHFAAKKYAIDILKILLAKGSDVNLIDSKGNTALHYVLKYTQIDDSRSEHSETSDIPTENNSIDIINILIKKSGDINKKDSRGYTPLHYAVNNMQIEVVKLLLNSNKIEINALSRNNNTSLHCAAENGAVDILKILLENGSDAKIINCQGYTVLHYAVKYCQEEVVEFLLNSNLIETNAVTLNNKTALHLAAYNGSIDILRMLLEKGSDVKLKDSNGYTPLHYAVNRNFIKVVELLFSTNSIDISSVTNNYETALHLAATNGSLVIIKYLLNKGSDINVKDSKGYTPLHHASKNNHVEVVKYLLNSNQIEIDAVTKNNETALHFIAKKGAIDPIKVLLDKGSNVNIKDCRGWTLLHFAVVHCHPSAVRMLLNNNKININCLTNQNDSALHLAAMHGCFKIARILIAKNIDVNIVNHFGQTAANLAERYNRLKMQDYIIKQSGMKSVSKLEEDGFNQ